ncbi:potassium-transporting ATPase subunit A [Listeria fleischmannii subsp. fleischmannii LU2006-1]|nr:potassium-transporting ATPase subunit A [Listeria fleischmannii subsp. fleischmannii LU2006-1]
MSLVLLKNILFIIVLIGLAIPLGRYMYAVMKGSRTFLSRVLQPVETWIYKGMGENSTASMSPKKYMHYPY